jgi:hypothetical protein
MNHLWFGFNLPEAIAAPILHVNSKGQVEYEPSFSQVRSRSEPHPIQIHAAQCPPGGTQFLCEELGFCVSLLETMRTSVGETIDLSHGL